MTSKRQKQVANLIHQGISEVFQRDCSHMFGNAILGVNYIKLSPDLKIANIYMSIFNGDENTIKEVQDNAKKLRYFLSQRLKNNLRTIPELRFFLDDMAEYSDNINKIIDGLDIPGEKDDDES